MMNKSKDQVRRFYLPYGDGVIDIPLSHEDVRRIMLLFEEYPNEYEGTEGVLKALEVIRKK